MALGLAEFCGEERANQLLRQFGADDARAKAEHIEIVVLNTLASGEGVVAERGADVSHLVGGDAGADAATADEHTAVHLV